MQTITLLTRLFLIFLSVLSLPAFTDTPYSDKEFHDRMEQLISLPLEELLKIKVTSSTLTDETIRSAPSSVSIVTKEDIRRLNANRLTEIVNLVPGFQSYRLDGNGQQYSITSRGRRLGTSGIETLILIDGQRLNSDFGGGTNLHNGYISLDNIERVEFIRGPGSAIYGSNAFTGVINLVSQAQSEAHVAVKTLNGTGTASQASIQWQKEINQLNTQSFVNFINDEGQRLEIYEPFQDALIDSRDPYQFKEVYLKAEYQDINASFYHSETQADQFYVGGFASNQENNVEATSSFLNLTYDKTLNKSLSLSAKASLARRRFDLAVLISPSLPPNELGISGEIEEQEPLAELTLRYLGENDQKALIGFEWRRPEIIDSDANLFGILDTYLPQAPLTHRTIYGLFAQFQGAVSERLHFVLGLRHDDYSHFGAHSSPRGGLIWQYDQKQTVKWLYGESFRAPSRSETDVENSSAVVANPNLTPEVARTTELIWQSLHQQDLLAATLFYIELDNIITDAQTTPIERYNTGYETVSGLELEWHKQWSDNLSGRLSASWVFDDAGQEDIETDFFTAMSLVYLTNHYSGALMINHQSNKEDNFVQSTETKTRKISKRSFLDAHFRYFFPHDIEAYLHLDNITNEDYYSVALRSENSQGVPNRSSRATIGMRLSF